MFQPPQMPRMPGMQRPSLGAMPAPGQQPFGQMPQMPQMQMPFGQGGQPFGQMPQMPQGQFQQNPQYQQAMQMLQDWRQRAPNFGRDGRFQDWRNQFQDWRQQMMDWRQQRPQFSGPNTLEALQGWRQAMPTMPQFGGFGG